MVQSYAVVTQNPNTGEVWNYLYHGTMTDCLNKFRRLMDDGYSFEELSILDLVSNRHVSIVL